MLSSEIVDKKKWTYQDYVKLDDDSVRYEIIEGELIMVPAPDLGHQDLSRDLEFFLWTHIKKYELGKIYDAPLDVVLDEENVVQPDLVFVSASNQKILKSHGIEGSPDLVVEILSPSSLYRDRHQKKALYQKFKIPEYWIVDPANQSIEVFHLENEEYRLYSFAAGKGKIKSAVIDRLELDLAELFHASRSVDSG